MEFFDDIITYEGFKNDTGNENKHFKIEANVFKNENSEIHTHEDVSNF